MTAITTQALMVNNIGAAVSIFIKATREPTVAPIPKRTLPAMEFAVPAMVGNFSKIDAIALEEISEFCPTKIATPSAIDQKPRSKKATNISQIPAIN